MTEMTEGCFHILYDPADGEMIDGIKEVIRSTYDRVRRDFELLESGGIIEFCLCPDVDRFIEYSGKSKENYQDWMVGWADYNQKRVCVLSPRVVRDRSEAEMMKVIAHEIVHIALDVLAHEDETALWLAEGAALLYAGQIEKKYVSGDNFPGLRNLESEDAFADNGGYDYAGVYVWYFIRKFGTACFKEIYRKAAKAGAYLYPGFEAEAVAAFLAQDALT